MNLKRQYLTNNLCYKSKTVRAVKGLMLHSTGANNPYLKRYIYPDPDGTIGTNANNNHWNVARPGGNEVCCHGFIGYCNDGKTIAFVNTIPYNWRGWHSGAGSNGNADKLGYVGIEICEDGLTDSTYFNKVYNEAVEVFAYLCKTYSLNPLGKTTDGYPVITTHCESAKLGIASNHADVMHWFSKHNKTMDDFRNDVNAIVNPKTKKVNGENMDILRANSSGYEVKVAQSILKGLGYYDGAIDGKWGSKSQAACKAWKTAIGFTPVNGGMIAAAWDKLLHG